MNYYIEKVDVRVILYLIFNRKGISSIYALENYNLKDNIVFNFILSNILKIQVVNLSFFAGNLSYFSGEAVTISASRLSSTHSVSIALEMYDKLSLRVKWLSNYITEPLIIHLAKSIDAELRPFILRLLVIEVLNEGRFKPIYLCKRSNLFSYNNDFYENCSVEVRSIGGNSQFLYALILPLKVFAKKLYKYYLSKNDKEINYLVLNSKPIVLSFQTNTLRYDLSYRGQPSWIDRNINFPEFNTLIISNLGEPKLGKNFLTQEADFDKIGSNSVFTISNNLFESSSLLIFLYNYSILYFKSIVKYGLLNKSCREHFISIIKLLEVNLSLQLFLKKHNVSVIYFDESNDIVTDAATLANFHRPIRTFSKQYSNLPFFSIQMISYVDTKFIFSKNFKNVYKQNGLGPKSFIEVGYINDFIAGHVNHRAQRIRRDLESKGVEFVLCYFDERVDLSKFGHVSGEEHYKQLLSLIDHLLETPNFGLVIKSQFTRYTPSRFYADCGKIRDALNTGRYVELNIGKIFNRNDIYATEAALIADLCVSHKFGATAGLEAAIAGKRVVLLNDNDIVTVHDKIYSTEEIEFSSFDELFNALSSSIHHSDLGNWNKILTYFDPYLDGKSQDRIYETLNKAALYLEGHEKF